MFGEAEAGEFGAGVGIMVGVEVGDMSTTLANVLAVAPIIE